MTRIEHINWCKQRAREYVQAGDLLEAVTSMMSDLGKHPETKEAGGGGALAMLGLLALQQAQSGDRDGVVDLVVSSTGAQFTSDVSVLRSDGAGGFGPAARATVGSSLSSGRGRPGARGGSPRSGRPSESRGRSREGSSREGSRWGRSPFIGKAVLGRFKVFL